MDDFQRSLLNVFATGDLDRAVPRRKDQSWLERSAASSAARYIPFFKGRFLLANSSVNTPAWLSYGEIAQFVESAQVRVFLGYGDSIAYFAADIVDASFVERYSATGCRLADLRKYGSKLRSRDASVLSYAKALFHWHRAHRHCGYCGSETMQGQAGHVRQCRNEACGRIHFPRIDPAIIVAVRFEDRCLFGRQPTWPENRYSVIAGFVEPGESVEQAVVREVEEETNIRLSTVNYRSSQPWPFPGSIMLGFDATAANEDISLNDGELQEAHWRSAEEVVEGLTTGEFLLPPKLSIAYRLIEEWFDLRSAEPLAQLLDRTGRHTELN